MFATIGANEANDLPGISADRFGDVSWLAQRPTRTLYVHWLLRTGEVSNNKGDAFRAPGVYVQRFALCQAAGDVAPVPPI